MERLSTGTRFIIAAIFIIVVVIGTALLQMQLAFSTYLAFFICLLATCALFWIVGD